MKKGEKKGLNEEVLKATGKEGSLPNVEFDGSNLLSGGKRYAYVQANGLKGVQESVYSLGHGLITPSRLKKLKEDPRTWAARAKREESEAQSRGSRLHDYLANNPFRMDGEKWEEKDRRVLERYYSIVAKRLKRYPGMRVEREEERLATIFCNLEISYSRNFGGWYEYDSRCVELPVLSRSDQVWGWRDLKKILDFKLNGGEKTGNMVQLICEGMANLGERNFPKLSIYNLEAGEETEYRSLNGEETLIWFLQILTYGNLLMMGGWKGAESGNERLRNLKIKGKRIELTECQERFERAWRMIGETVEVRRVEI